MRYIMGQRKKSKKRNAVKLLGVLALALLLLITAAAVLNPYFERRVYKLEYPDEIKLYSEEYSLDPHFVAAVIHCESSNRNVAVSEKGAIGLMQLMPDTGKWIYEKVYDSELDSLDRLREPALNIELGCWYLNNLVNKYESRELALMAYNAGPGNVDKWLASGKVTKTSDTEDIPFAQTGAYVENVLAAYVKYKDLYEDSF